MVTYITDLIRLITDRINRFITVENFFSEKMFIYKIIR